MKINSLLTMLTMSTFCAVSGFAATPLGSAFTYQGRLNDGGTPANGNYDMIFNLYDAPTNGNVIGSFSIFGAVPVSDGLFTLELNSNNEFGTNAFNGQARWLQIGVRTNALSPWVNLWPRQPLDPAPHAFYALNASNSINASFASTVADGSITSSKLAPGAVAWTNITGTPAPYTAGAGLSLNGSQFSVNFAGTGSANTAARTDHNHFGAVWGGNVSYGLGLSVSNAAANGAGLYGQQGTGSGFPYIFGNTAGIWGESSQGSGVYGASGYTNGNGVFGFATATNGANHGVEGVTASTSGSGVYGRQGSGSGAFASGLASGIWGDSSDSHGVVGTTKSGNSAYGVLGISTAMAGTSGGVYGESHSPNGKAVYGYSVTSSGTNCGVYGLTYSSNGFGIYGQNGAPAANAYRPYENGAAVFGQSQNDIGVAGISDSEDGVFGSSIDGIGVSGNSQNSSGVAAHSDTWVGVWATCDGLASVIAWGTSGAEGVWANSDSGEAVKAVSTSGVGVHAYSQSNSPIEAWSSVNNNDVRVFRVAPSGEVYARGSFHPNGADFAEMLPAEDRLEAGDVLVVGEDGKLARSTRAYQENVAGVYATKPGLIGGAPDGADLRGKIPLAVVGIVPVKVTSEAGPIKPGDKLTTSSTPGHAMKAGHHAEVGTVIGKALTPLQSKQGVIQMLVVLQ